jgi:hypothetical protein
MWRHGSLGEGLLYEHVETRVVHLGTSAFGKQRAFELAGIASRRRAARGRVAVHQRRRRSPAEIGSHFGEPTGRFLTPLLAGNLMTAKGKASR